MSQPQVRIPGLGGAIEGLSFVPVSARGALREAARQRDEMIERHRADPNAARVEVRGAQVE